METPSNEDEMENNNEMKTPESELIEETNVNQNTSDDTSSFDNSQIKNFLAGLKRKLITIDQRNSDSIEKIYDYLFDAKEELEHYISGQNHIILQINLPIKDKLQYIEQINHLQELYNEISILFGEGKNNNKCLTIVEQIPQLNTVIKEQETMKNTSGCSEDTQKWLDKMIITQKQDVHNFVVDINNKRKHIIEHYKKCGKLFINKSTNANKISLKSLRHIYDWYRNDENTVSSKQLNPLTLEDFLKFTDDYQIVITDVKKYGAQKDQFNKEKLVKMFNSLTNNKNEINWDSFISLIEKLAIQLFVDNNDPIKHLQNFLGLFDSTYEKNLTSLVKRKTMTDYSQTQYKIDTTLFKPFNKKQEETNGPHQHNIRHEVSDSSLQVSYKNKFLANKKSAEDFNQTSNNNQSLSPLIKSPHIKNKTNESINEMPEKNTITSKQKDRAKEMEQIEQKQLSDSLENVDKRINNVNETSPRKQKK